MGVVTVRLNNKISGFVTLLSKEANKSKSEVVRELLTKATREEKTNYWLKKYKHKEITLRKAAKELGVPLWKVLEIVGENHSYELHDLQRDLRTIGE